MKKEETYNELQRLKSEGLTQNQVSLRMNMCYRTVHKYWDDIIDCLKKYPEMSSAQMRTWICMKRNVPNLDIVDRTFQKYVTNLRRELDIPKPSQSKELDTPNSTTSKKSSVLKKLNSKKRIISQITPEMHKKPQKRSHEEFL